MTTVILAEKPSQARSYVQALSKEHKKTRLGINLVS